MKEAKTIPIRRCVGCSEKKPKVELLRVVRMSDGTVAIDRAGKAPGRGAYLCRDAECFKKALKKRRLEQTLHSKVPEPVLNELKQEMQWDE